MENNKEKLIEKAIALCKNYVHNCSFIQFNNIDNQLDAKITVY